MTISPINIISYISSMKSDLQKNYKNNKNLIVKNDTKETPKVSLGFDRGIDYIPIKKKLIEKFDECIDTINTLDIEDSNYQRKKNMITKRIIYTLIAIVQLRNGSRIIEAVDAFTKFIESKDLTKREIIKIAKSESKKYKDGKSFKTKARYRKIIFPNWIVINTTLLDDIYDVLTEIPKERLKKRVLDYLLKYFKCNTHSLRYSCINYLIYEKQRPLNDVAKFVGHINLNQLTTYTQQKNCDKLFDIDM